MKPRAPLRGILLLLAACATAGCSSCKGGSTTSGDHPAATSSAAPTPNKPPQSNPAPRVDLVAALPTCDLDHRGILLDLGTDAMIGRFGWLSGIPEGVDPVEHDGSTWIRVSDRTLTLSFVLPESSPIFVAARVQGLAAKSASVTLDDQPLGSLSLQKGQIRTASTGVTTMPADAGMHTIKIRFAGRARSSVGPEPFADIDWVRIGVPDESPVTYGAPTLRDLVLPAAALSGVPHRSIGLRAPGAVRCAMRVPESARLRAAVGLLGVGEGDAEIRALRDGQKPEVLQTIHLTGGEKATWVDVDLPLAKVSRQIMALELRAVSAPPGGRVLFGDPAIIVPAPSSVGASPLASARAAILVVLDGVERSNLPPWSGVPAPTLNTLSELALSATTFDRHRAPTTVVASVMASLITALPPAAHGLTDANARLSASLTNIAAVARDASVRTAMFTGVPFSFKAFGFSGGWERYVEHSPVSGDLATAPLDSATAWITELARDAPDARLLAVIHARGGHPPWDISPKELGEVPPPDYAGPIEPRRSAQVLATLRNRKNRALSPTDLARVKALSTLALAGQDRALGALISALKTAGLWDSTLLIVTGDVSSGSSESSLFMDGGELRESTLTLPLYIHFPGGAYGGARVPEPTEIVDIPFTMLTSMGLTFSRRLFGRDLSVVVSGTSGGGWDAPQIAMIDDRYSSRWGDLILSGREGAPPDLCDMSVDPTCAKSRRDVMPISAPAIFRRTVAADNRARTPPTAREPATIDADTLSALRVWGAAE